MSRVFGFDAFNKDLNVLKQRFPQEIEGFLVEIASRGLRKAKQRSPVDTGELRRNWNVGKVKRSGDTLSIELYNNTEYAPYVEYGHRTRNGGFVPGVYMLEITLMELERELPRHLYKLLQRLI